MKHRIKVPTDSNIKSKGVAWIASVTLWSFFITVALSFISNGIIPDLSLALEFSLLALFILINILFDIIGTAVAAASATPFNSMNSRNVKGSRKALYLVRNAEKVSNFCNDVIGDICGIITGVVTSVIVVNFVERYGINSLYFSIIIASIVSCITIASKAFGKTYAIRNSNQIVYQVALLLCVFKREKEKQK